MEPLIIIAAVLISLAIGLVVGMALRKKLQNLKFKEQKTRQKD